MPARSLVPLVAVLVTACGAELAPDQALPDVVCDAGACALEVPDRIAGPFALAPGCAGDVAIAPSLLTLVGAGDRVVIAGRLADRNGQPVGGTQTLMLTAAATGRCPELAVVPAADLEPVTGTAHTTDADGELLAFAGDGAGTRRVVRYDGQAWSPSSPVRDPPPPPLPASEEGQPVTMAIRLSGERVLVLRSPFTRTHPKLRAPVLRVELFDMAAQPPALAWEMAQTQATWPGLGEALGVLGRLYAYALPDGEGTTGRLTVMGSAGRGLSVLLTDRRIEQVGPPRSTRDPAPNQGASVVLLPLRPGAGAYRPGAVLLASGSSLTGSWVAEDLRRMDVYDPGLGVWSAVGTLPTYRYLSTPVLLPDGRIALISGFLEEDRRILYVDPRRGFAVTPGRARLGRPRGAGGCVLLADGRVLVGGGLATIESAREPPDFDVLEPPYLAPGRARPTIATAPSTIAAAGSFTLAMGAGPPPDEIVLLAFGSASVGHDPNQRLVELSITGKDAQGALIVAGPPPSWAPPGRYLLFAVADHVPSVGLPVRVTGN